MTNQRNSTLLKAICMFLQRRLRLVYKLTGELEGEIIAYRLAGLSDTADPPQT